jgi:hypothetical protein
MKSILCCALVVFACRAAWGGSCDHCGCRSSSCRKVCRVVCETKKVPKTTYDCACEEFCVPGPSVRSTVCDACGNKHHVYAPTCGKLRTRTKLVKYDSIEEKTVYRWVVENVCCDCAANAGAGADADRRATGALVVPVRADSPAEDGAGLAADVQGAGEEPKFDVRRLLRPLGVQR